jgi:gluconate 2-dehydrogenase gamma chain
MKESPEKIFWPPGRGLSRREFLKLSAGVTGTLLLGGCDIGGDEADTTTTLATGEKYPAVPVAPVSPPEPGRLQFFTGREARTLDALTARIFPGDADDPGAREAGVVTYIDHMLAMADFVEPTYHAAPFAEPYSEDSPPAPDDENTIWVPEDELERYGYQSSLTSGEVFRMGLVALDRHARANAGGDFAGLSEEQQDEIVTALAEGEADGFEPFGPEAFFQTVLRATGEGLFADPLYGGNRDFVGWRLLGYPGAQRAYTEAEVQEGTEREPWGLDELPPFYPGRSGTGGDQSPVVGPDAPVDSPAAPEGLHQDR